MPPTSTRRPTAISMPRARSSSERRSASDRPVYKVEIAPEDGYYPMPYMARKADGQAWDSDGTTPRAARAESRQPFMPDGHRTFDEIDRLGIGTAGTGSLVSNKAEVEFFRIAPSGGYLKGRSGESEDVAPEKPGKDFFPYRPAHLGFSPPRMTLARITNMAQRILSSGKYDGAIWTQGSPRIEETMYWFNLAMDVTVPICGNASQRYHGEISNDGPKNITDSVDYLYSRVWADAEGRNRAGMVLIQDQRVFAAREVMKADARPGGYVVTGGTGGILGVSGGTGGVVLRFVPVTRHTYTSEVKVTARPHRSRATGATAPRSSRSMWPSRAPPASCSTPRSRRSRSSRMRAISRMITTATRSRKSMSRPSSITS